MIKLEFVTIVILMMNLINNIQLEKKVKNLLKIVEKSNNPVGKKHNCIVGVSGGCDSSYLL